MRGVRVRGVSHVDDSGCWVSVEEPARVEAWEFFGAGAALVVGLREEGPVPWLGGPFSKLGGVGVHVYAEELIGVDAASWDCEHHAGSKL